MLKLQESDVFKIIQSGNGIESKMRAVIENRNGYKDASPLLQSHYDNIKKKYSSDSLMPKIMNALSIGTLIVKYSNEPTVRLPTYLPFFKYGLKDKISRVVIDISQYSIIHSNPDGTDEISIDIPKLWCLLSSGYICLKIGNSSHFVPQTVAVLTSDMWGNLFVKPLNKTIGLYTDQARYNAFRYFASKFFLMHILEHPQASVEGSLQGIYRNKSLLIQEIEDTLNNRDIHIEESFKTLCETLFNNEITKIRFGNNVSQMNISSYLTSYVSMYGNNTLLSLASFPYFVYLIIAANNRSYLVNHKVLEDVCMNRQQYVKLLKAIYDDISNI